MDFPCHILFFDCFKTRPARDAEEVLMDEEWSKKPGSRHNLLGQGPNNLLWGGLKIVAMLLFRTLQALVYLYFKLYDTVI